MLWHAEEGRMDFGEVLTRAWQITWRYKGLWVLGLLAGCGTGGGGGGGGGSPSSTGAGPQSYGQIEQVIRPWLPSAAR